MMAREGKHSIVKRDLLRVIARLGMSRDYSDSTGLNRMMTSKKPQRGRGFWGLCQAQERLALDSPRLRGTGKNGEKIPCYGTN